MSCEYKLHDNSKIDMQIKILRCTIFINLNIRYFAFTDLNYIINKTRK